MSRSSLKQFLSCRRGKLIACINVVAAVMITAAIVVAVSNSADPQSGRKPVNITNDIAKSDNGSAEPESDEKSDADDKITEKKESDKTVDDNIQQILDDVRSLSGDTVMSISEFDKLKADLAKMHVTIDNADAVETPRSKYGSDKYRDVLMVSTVMSFKSDKSDAHTWNIVVDVKRGQSMTADFDLEYIQRNSAVNMRKSGDPVYNATINWKLVSSDDSKSATLFCLNPDWHYASAS